MWWSMTAFPALRSQRQRVSGLRATLGVLGHHGLLSGRLSKKKRGRVNERERKGQERGTECVRGGKKEVHRNLQTIYLIYSKYKDKQSKKTEQKS